MKSPFESIGQVIKLLTPKEQRRLAIVMCGAVFMAVMNVIGVGSIMPFISVASQPTVIHTNPYLLVVYTAFKFQSDTQFLIFLGIVVLAFLLLANFAQALLQYMKVRFTSMRRHTLSLRLLKAYLGQPYPFFLNRNSYEFVKNINSEITQMVNGTLIQFVDFVSQLIQVTILTIFLFLVNPQSTLAIIVVVGIVYAAIYEGVRRTIKRLGVDRFNLNESLSRIISEAFWGIKEVKITGTEAVFSEEYIRPSKELARNASTSEIIGDIPKFVLETAAFSTIMIFVLITIIREGSFANAAATVGLFAFAGYRMIPAVQGLFKSLTKLKYGAPTADRLSKEFALSANAAPISKIIPEPMSFSRSFELRDISFTYPKIEKPVINGLSLAIGANELVGFAGKTGSGKTTIVDIILGLLEPQEGALVVDGVVVDRGNIRSWQANLGYVPQNIYLSNTSISANIAFGVPENMIDMDAVENAARMAQIHDFIVDELKQGYDTAIGERGIRISGGQRQRIGIARALYRNPSMLILDEATSALDGQTEYAVMEAIDALMGLKTIILIAHRLSTLRKCGKVFLVEKGRIIDKGTYDDLERRNEMYFRQH